MIKYEGSDWAKEGQAMDDANEFHYYTVPEAARLLHVSRATVWRWIEAEKLPAYRVGPRGIRIKKKDLEGIVRPAREKMETLENDSEPQDIWAGYDVKRVQEALVHSAGALKGVDRDKLIADIHASRQQDSTGRPA